MRNLRLRAAKLSLLKQQGSRAPPRKEPLEERWCEGWTCETDRKIGTGSMFLVSLSEMSVGGEDLLYFQA